MVKWASVELPVYIYVYIYIYIYTLIYIYIYIYQCAFDRRREAKCILWVMCTSQ